MDDWTGQDRSEVTTNTRAELNFRQARVADQRAGSKGCAFRFPAVQGA